MNSIDYSNTVIKFFVFQLFKLNSILFQVLFLDTSIEGTPHKPNKTKAKLLF
jgi:hypothetical protein